MNNRDCRGLQLPRFDRSGNVDSLIPPGKPLAHAFGYTGIDLNDRYAPPVVEGVPSPATTYDDNRDGQLTAIERPDDLDLGFAYEGTTDRLATITQPRGASQLGYDTKGRLGTLTSPDNVTLTYGSVVGAAVAWLETIESAARARISRPSATRSEVTTPRAWRCDESIGRLCMGGLRGKAVNGEWSHYAGPPPAGCSSLTYDWRKSGIVGRGSRLCPLGRPDKSRSRPFGIGA